MNRKGRKLRYIVLACAGNALTEVAVNDSGNVWMGTSLEGARLLARRFHPAKGRIYEVRRVAK